MRVIRAKHGESVVVCQQRGSPEDGDKEWVVIRRTVQGKDVDVRVCLEKRRTASLIMKLK